MLSYWLPSTHYNDQSTPNLNQRDQERAADYISSCLYDPFPPCSGPLWLGTNYFCFLSGTTPFAVKTAPHPNKTGKLLRYLSLDGHRKEIYTMKTLLLLLSCISILARHKDYIFCTCFRGVLARNYGCQYVCCALILRDLQPGNHTQSHGLLYKLNLDYNHLHLIFFCLSIRFCAANLN